MATRQLKNVPFRFKVALNSKPVFGAFGADDLAGQFETVTLPVPSRGSEEWTGSGVTTEQIRTVLLPMTAQYTMGGWDERLRLGQYNDDAILTCFEYYRPVGAGTPFANEEGMVRWKTTEHIITGPLQEIDTQSRGQATINRTIIMQDVYKYEIKGTLAANETTGYTLRLVDIINGVNKVRRLKEGVSDAIATQSNTELVDVL